MRGGTANCSVIISDTPVGSPIISVADVLVAMNLPSMDKYENAVVPGGIIICDSALIEKDISRNDISVFRIPATKIAQEAGIPTLANMIMMGKLLRESNALTYESVDEALQKVVSAKHAEHVRGKSQGY